MARRRSSRRRSYRSRARAFYRKRQNPINNIVAGGTGILAFVSQLSGKDTNNSSFQSLGATQKAKFLINDITGRISGINMFNDVQQFPVTRNPAGVINVWTGSGLASMLYGHFAPRGAPMKAMAKKVGAAAFIGGVVGGFFDAPSRAGGGVNSRASIGAASRSIDSNPASQVNGFSGNYIG